MRGRFAFVFAGFGLVVLRGWAEAASTCPTPLGALVAIEGQVEFREHASETWRAAALNVPLCPGAMVRVGDRSRATAALPDAPTYRIDQNTTFHLVSAPAKRERPAVIRLVEGALYIFSRRPRTLTINTPFVDAAVEGTEFLVRAERSRTVVTVFEGTVVARNEHGETRASAGYAAIAEAGQAPIARLIVRPRDAVEWAVHYPPILSVLADPRAAAAAEVPQPIRDAARRASRGDIPGALDRLDAVPSAERGASFHLHRAAILLSVGRVDEARADIDRALAQDPNAGLAYALRAVIAVAQNDNERALADGRRAVELDPQSAAAWIALSYAQQASFDLDSARDSLRTAVEAQPKDALAWARLSELWLMAGRRDRARQAAETAADLAPDLARVQSVLGFAALAEFRTQTARQAFERALGRDPADPLARFGLGLARIRQGDLETGRNDIEAAVALDPNRSLLRSYLGKAYFEERRAELAGEQFAIAKELDPKDPTPFLYDAIRKQSENRPVEALRDLEKSIALNDNRAVYRSRELLDQDRAARGTSLARIYNDLGFEQLGIREATNSLTADPANAAAHRSLSDLYMTQPRREIARASELLQAQLLQDININPVQPSLSATNLNIFARGGPAHPGFNEFTPLFQRNQAQLNLSGLAGSDSTYGGEAVVSGIYDRLSVSAGQFHYESDGFRKNFDLKHDISDFFMQTAIAPNLSVQGEVIRRRTESGDRVLSYPEFLARGLRQDLDEDIARLGVLFSPLPGSTIIASGIYSNRHAKTSVDLAPTRRNEARLKDDGVQNEVAYLWSSNFVTINTGVGFYDVDRRHRELVDMADSPPLFDTTTHSNINQATGYMYIYKNILDNLTLTIGFDYATYSQDYLTDNISVKKTSPKLGMQWNISPDAQLRLAAFRTVKPPLIADRTIQPTHVSGFNQFFDDANGTETRFYGAGLDISLSQAVDVGVEVSRRSFSEPIPAFFPEDGADLGNRDEDLYRAYVYWVPSLEWAVSGELQYDLYSREMGNEFGVPEKAATLGLPISISYFNYTGLFSSLSGTLLHQDVDLGRGENQVDNTFFVVDATMGWRLPRKRGLLSFQVRNMFDTRTKFQDDSYRQFRDAFSSQIENRPTTLGFIPERTYLASATFSF